MLGSLRGRLAISNLAITLIALVVLTVVFAQLLRQRGIDSAQAFISQEANLVRRDVNHEVPLALAVPQRISLRAFYSFFLHDSAFLNKRIIFFSASGQCGFDSHGLTPKLLKQDNPPNGCTASGASWLLAPVAERRSVAGFRKRGNATYLIDQRPTIGVVRNGKARPSAVILITPQSAVIPSITAIAPGFFLAALTAGIVWLVMAIVFGYTVSRPLRKVSNAAKAMATGDYSQSVDISSGGEIGDLGASFNNMVTQVRTASQLLKDFVANVSHDLRTPLTLISGYAASVLDGTAGNRHEVEQAVEVIAEEAGRMTRLVDDLLQLTRLESGLKRFDQKPVSLALLADRSIRRVTAAGERHVENSVPSTLPLAFVDEELVDRVLTNLLTNALEHTPTEGRVVVSARSTRDWIEVSVSDNGVGITAEDQTRIFERLYRADPGRARDDGHSGLGLPIVKEIIETHGGIVRVESAPGTGARFTVTVPRFVRS